MSLKYEPASEPLHRFAVVAVSSGAAFRTGQGCWAPSDDLARVQSGLRHALEVVPWGVFISERFIIFQLTKVSRPFVCIYLR